jgi:hypothetical protein
LKWNNAAINVTMMKRGRIPHDGNSGTEGDGEGVLVGIVIETLGLGIACGLGSVKNGIKVTLPKGKLVGE